VETMKSHRWIRSSGATAAWLLAVAALALPAGSGCIASNRIVGHRIHEAAAWYGELGITGHLNEITIRSGSRLNKLSLIGDGNYVIVEEGVTLGKIEIWGENNIVSVPQSLVIRKNVSGSKSVVVPRAPGEAPPRRTSAPPPTAQPMAEEPAEELPAETSEPPAPAPETSAQPSSAQPGLQPGISPAEPRSVPQPGITPAGSPPQDD